MNSGLFFQYPSWFILFCLMAGGIYAFFFYWREKNFSAQGKLTGIWRILLAVLRFVSVAVLCILLLSPFLRIRNTQTIKPVVALVVDNSESMRQALGKDTASFREKIRVLIGSLSQKYDVVTYGAGDNLARSSEFRFDQKATNLSDALDEVNETYYNRNLGAVILASDGIYNKGLNPIYAAAKLPCPVFTIALGDTTTQKDQRIASVYHNKIAYLNDNFAVRADIEAGNLAGKKSRLQIFEIAGGEAPRLLQSRDVAVQTNPFFLTTDFIVPALKTGIAHYRLVLSPVDGEVTLRNNSREVFVEVLDGRQKILLVALAPHPDLGAFKAAVETNKNYQLDVCYADNIPADLKPYSLLMLHQLPAAGINTAALMEQIQSGKKPALFVLGAQSSVQELLKAQTALSLKAGGDRLNEVTPAFEKSFSLFTISDKTTAALAKLPPLSNFFGSYKAGPSAKVLLYQKINSVVTDYPLWLFSETGESKIGIIAGEGIWRWRLSDYQMNKNNDATNEIINKTVQYLALKTDKRPFRVNVAKNIFQDNEAVLLEAQLYNASFEPVNTPEVNVTITDEKGSRAAYVFQRKETGYALNAGFFPTGTYSYSASVTLGNTSYTAVGKFSVSPVQLEEMRTRADFQVMYQLAAQHQGMITEWKTMEKIADQLNADNNLKPLLFDTYETRSAINLKLIFFLLLLLLASEWSVRKYLGGY